MAGVAFELAASPDLDGAPPPRAKTRPDLGDLRFRALMAEAEWDSLPSPIRRRFSKRLAGGQTIVYAGEILQSRTSRAGWCLVQLARLIGGPLPLTTDIHVPSVVAVTEDIASGGQIWTRLYARRNGFPQVVHSSKRFAGPTGLEEYVGRGIGMTLTVHARDRALVFRSKNYFVQLCGRRFFLPHWLCPGALSVTHAELRHVPQQWEPLLRKRTCAAEGIEQDDDSKKCRPALGDGKFSFTLEIVHPRFGLLLHQMGVFQEIAP
jgi:Domain of unknown function (DUF4166)